MMIPFVDLHRQYESIAAEISAAIEDVIARSAFIGGAPVERFERAFADYCEAEHCVGVANGTDAIELTLRALGIGPGDEVITVANTFIASAAAISATGATPTLVDIDPATYQMDVHALAKAITARTKAILPVHLYGHPADLDPILALASEHGLHVVEDACQAHGARYKGRRVGALGIAGCFSFYPGKNLGAYGDGGAIVTNDEALATRIRQIANHGRIDKYRHAIVGRNSRLDGLQAAILETKLRHLDRWNESRRQIAARFTMQLAESGAITPVTAPEVEPVYHLYVIRTTERAALQAALTAAEIDSGIHYPLPIHLQPAYTDVFAAQGIGPGNFPIAEAYAESILSLPIYAELTSEEIDRICGVVERVTSRHPGLRPGGGDQQKDAVSALGVIDDERFAMCRQIAADVIIGDDVVIYDFVNLYGCSIGSETKIGTFVEIQRGAVVGNRVKVSSHSFICEGVTIEDDVFIGHGVCFINDRYPRATTEGRPQTGTDWNLEATRVCQGASIGTNATILCGLTIGEGAIIGAGSVVTSDVAPRSVVFGNPARPHPRLGVEQQLLEPVIMERDNR